jgi:uncharacterized protein (UPF0264 family)
LHDNSHYRQTEMTRLLVSVRSSFEARAALAGGADLIDVKEPSRGALGAADAEAWRAVIAAVAGRAPISVALGELCCGAVAVNNDLAARVRYAKLGLAGSARMSDWSTRWAAALTRLPAGVSPVAVAYADHSAASAPSPEEVLRHGLRLGCSALLVDTFHKNGGGLLEYLSGDELARLVDRARAAAMTVVLAGSLSAQSLPKAVSLAPDYIAVRGAVCRGRRCGAVDERLVRQLAVLISQSNAQR